jgi:thymidine phosphorylase
LYQSTGELIGVHEAGLSEGAWTQLGLQPGDRISVEHPEAIPSLSHVRSRIYGHRFNDNSLHAIIRDIVDGHYSDIVISAFIATCATWQLDQAEVLSLTRAMVNSGDRLSWNVDVVADKHSAGGLPGNRTTPIVVPIVAALGLVIPKTSSRAITSPSGTADTMEALAPVDLDLASIRRVVESEGGCIVWGGAVRLSPADDVLIRVERALDIDTEGQLIASVLSKKIAAGATHLVIDMPVGATAKVRTQHAASKLTAGLTEIAEAFGIRIRIVEAHGDQPVGRGIGPALEARDVLDVLRCAKDVPADLRERSIALSGALLELCGAAKAGSGSTLAAQCLDDGRAWAKFQRICEAQGGLRTPPQSSQRMPIVATRSGQLTAIDNRKLGMIAKLAGAPDAKAAGVEMHLRLGASVSGKQPIATVHAQSPGELAYAMEYVAANPDIFQITP